MTDSSQGVPTADAIRHLKELVDIGILTDDEFAARRRQLGA
ncbi:MAG: SHOCT domain-containing protein [Microthrixaceae bacterium]|nr:SHOCT domain-containing protein [Microthrixaceae bacterium]